MESERDLLIQQIRRDIQSLEDTLQDKGRSAPTTHMPLTEQDQQAQALWRKLYTTPDEILLKSQAALGLHQHWTN